jgi:hypothetical protein
MPAAMAQPSIRIRSTGIPNQHGRLHIGRHRPVAQAEPGPLQQRPQREHDQAEPGPDPVGGVADRELRRAGEQHELVVRSAGERLHRRVDVGVPDDAGGGVENQEQPERDMTTPRPPRRSTGCTSPR